MKYPKVASSNILLSLFCMLECAVLGSNCTLQSEINGNNCMFCCAIWFLSVSLCQNLIYKIGNGKLICSIA